MNSRGRDSGVPASHSAADSPTLSVQLADSQRRGPCETAILCFQPATWSRATGRGYNAVDDCIHPPRFSGRSSGSPGFHRNGPCPVRAAPPQYPLPHARPVARAGARLHGQPRRPHAAPRPPGRGGAALPQHLRQHARLLPGAGHFSPASTPTQRHGGQRPAAPRSRPPSPSCCPTPATAPGSSASGTSTAASACPGFVPPGPSRQGFEFWAANECSHTHFHPHYFRDTDRPIAIDRFEPEVWTDLRIEFLRGEGRRATVLPDGPDGPASRPLRRRRICWCTTPPASRCAQLGG